MCPAPHVPVLQINSLLGVMPRAPRPPGISPNIPQASDRPAVRSLGLCSPPGARTARLLPAVPTRLGHPPWACEQHTGPARWHLNTVTCCPHIPDPARPHGPLPALLRSSLPGLSAVARAVPLESSCMSCSERTPGPLSQSPAGPPIKAHGPALIWLCHPHVPLTPCPHSPTGSALCHLLFLPSFFFGQPTAYRVPVSGIRSKL